LYRLAHGGPKDARQGNGPQTRTRIIEAIKRVKVNAARVVTSGGEEDWLERLAAALAVNTTLLADLHYAVIRQGIDLWSLRSRIDGGIFSEADLAAVKVLAEIEIDKIVPARGHSDPPLMRLVRELTPTWSSVTATSPYPKNDREGNKVCPFAIWVSELIKAAGLHPPPANTVPRIIRRQKSKNRVPR